jgi:hypothetical protein
MFGPSDRRIGPSRNATPSLVSDPRQSEDQGRYIARQRYLETASPNSRYSATTVFSRGGEYVRFHAPRRIAAHQIRIASSVRVLREPDTVHPRSDEEPSGSKAGFVRAFDPCVRFGSFVLIRGPGVRSSPRRAPKRRDLQHSPPDGRRLPQMGPTRRWRSPGRCKKADIGSQRIGHHQPEQRNSLPLRSTPRSLRRGEVRSSCRTSAPSPWQGARETAT